MAAGDTLLQLSRAAGLAAYVVLWLDMCLGVSLTGRVNLPVLSRWRMGDLHQFTGLMSIGLLTTHIAVLVGLKENAFTVPELVVPLLRQSNPAAPLLGISGLYVLLLVIAISHARRYVGLRLWRLVHMFSFVGFALALGHAVMAGPDTSVWWVRTMYVYSVLVLAELTYRRVRHAVATRKAESGGRRAIEVAATRA